MIPAILAAPVVGSVVGSVVNNVIGGVANLFSSPQSSAPSSSTTFSPYLNNATTATAAQPPIGSAPSGTMQSGDWNQMGPVDLKSWAQGLAGKHLDATDASGRTITGVVGGVQQLGSTLALNIGGHLVSLSQLKQVTWSPAVA